MPRPAGWYWRFTPEERRAYNQKQSSRYDSPDRPDSNTPRWVGKEIRVRILVEGGDPGDINAVTIQAAQLALENEELGRSYLCGDYLPRFCHSMAGTWRRRMTDKSKDRLRAIAAERIAQVNSTQFESEQPQA